MSLRAGAAVAKTAPPPRSAAAVVNSRSPSMQTQCTLSIAGPIRRLHNRILIATGDPRLLKVPAGKPWRIMALSAPEESSSDVTADLSDGDLRDLWDAIPKPLITIGKKGVEKSHCNSLQNLLMAHNIVKVKFVAASVGLEEMQVLADGSGATFLQQKGSTFMFAKGSLSRAELQEVGARNTERKEKRAAHRNVRREQRREDPPEPGPIMDLALQRLVKAGKLQAGDVDKTAAWAMADLPNDEAREAAAKQMTPHAISSVVNKSAWITSICRRAARKFGSAPPA